MKKVLIAVIQLHKTSAGTIRNIMEQVRYFQARDCEVHLISEVFNPEIIKGYDLKIHKTFPWIKKTGRKRRWWFDLQVKRLQKKHHFETHMGAEATQNGIKEATGSRVPNKKPSEGAQGSPRPPGTGISHCGNTSALEKTPQLYI